jgi:lipopolysaccharide transport system ATP-binding protein
MSETVIKVEGLHKKFCQSLKRSLFYGTIDAAKSMFGFPIENVDLRKKEFWALQDINFELKRGETLGLIGQNGSGKTTLLRLLNGIFPPDKGKITINGRIGALIAVGAGFHPHMTGRENIYLNGTILGMTKSEIKRKFDEIVDFAEIGNFIDSPVATYSSGMTVRLGFAIAIHCEPDILLLDEILAVGDGKFHQKSFSKINKLLTNGTSVVFVSHSMQLIQMICKDAAFMDFGKIIQYGRVEDVVGFYYNKCAINVFENSENRKENFVSSYNVSYQYFKFFNSKGEETRTFESGDDIIAEWKYKMGFEIERVSVYFGMANDSFTFSAYSTAKTYDNFKIDKINSDTICRIRINKPYLSPGEYVVGIGLWDENMRDCYYNDYESTGKIKITSRNKIITRFQYDHEWNFDNII